MTDGTTGAVKYHTTAMRGGECGIGGRSDNSHRVAHLDQIISKRLIRDACVTDGTAGAGRYHPTAMRGSECGIGGGGDEMSPRCPPQPDHQHAPDKERMRD